MKYLAPAGTPISLFDVAAGLGAGAFGSAHKQLLANLLQISDRQQGWLMSSGRAAMSVIVEAMRAAAQVEKRADKDEVIVPAYTCYSVPAAIARAGLRVRLCDIDPRSLSYDLDALRRTDCSRVLAIVTANLYGVPNDLIAIEAFARERGIFMLDDAAQALGASIAGRPVGGFGDVGLYSFDKGKNIATIQGGAIVACAGELANAIDAGYARLPNTPVIEAAMLSVKLAAYAVLLHPTAYGLIRRVPFLGLGQTPYEVRCLMAKYSDVLAGMAERLLKRLERLTAVRRANANAMISALHSVPAVKQIALLPGAEPAFARLPLFVRDPSTRSTILQTLDRAGIGATGSYPAALCDVPEASAVINNNEQNFSGARQVAASIVTLPTHPYCPANLPQTVHSLLLSAA